MLMRLIEESGKKAPEIFARANINPQHFSKIRNNPDYKTTKQTVLAFVIALKLNFEQAEKFTFRRRFYFVKCYSRRCYCSFFIVKDYFDLSEVNLYCRLSVYLMRFWQYILIAESGCSRVTNRSAKMCVATLIGPGAGGRDYNRRFIPYLRRPSNKAELSNFDSLADYIKIFVKIAITRSKVSKQQCISELTKLNARNDVEYFIVK